MATPAELGYRMPAEWEPHASTWLTWPRPDGISFPDKYHQVPPVYAQLILHLVQVEDVNINVWDAAMEAWVRDLLTQHRTPLERVQFHHFPAYEPWCRDHGPIFLVRDRAGHHERAVVDWGYNAWGGKYPPYDLDDIIPQRVAQLRQLPLFVPVDEGGSTGYPPLSHLNPVGPEPSARATPMVLEGGSIDVNGQGTLLTTESCLLNPNRNPQLNQSAITRFLSDFLGVTHLIWLGDGIVGDDTDGHIDDLARFVNPTTVVTVVEEDPADANYQLLQENWQRLRRARDQDGQPLRVVKLPMPGLVAHQGQRLPASYANFYLANGLVVVPTYRHANDQRALDILQAEFPRHRVVGIDAMELIWGLGSFHCITQQEPL